MKKLLTLLAAGAISMTAFADLTEFGWASAGLVFDNEGAVVASPTYGLSVLGDEAEMFAFVRDNAGQLEIDKADLQSFAEVGSSLLVLSAKSDGKWTSDFVTGTAAWIGQTAYAVLTSADSIANIVEGDYIGISLADGPLNELDGTLGEPRLAAQEFDNGGTVDINIQVVPEPATFGLMGIAGLGMYLARRKTRR